MRNETNSVTKKQEFKLVIEVDWDRMGRDGIDVEACRKEFQKILDEVPETEEMEKGIFVTNSFGHRSYFMMLLEDCEWFMKYVSKWLWIDPNGETCDVIKGNREMGKRCCYE